MDHVMCVLLAAIQNIYKIVNMETALGKYEGMWNDRWKDVILCTELDNPSKPRDYNRSLVHSSVFPSVIHYLS